MSPDEAWREMVDLSQEIEGEPDPTRAEAIATFNAATPARLVRPLRTLVVEIEQWGPREWKATSEQVSGFAVYGDSREAVERCARDDLEVWIDPAVTLEFRELGT